MGGRDNHITLWSIGFTLITSLLLCSAFIFPGHYHRKPVIHYTTNQAVEVIVYLVYSPENTPLYYTTRLQSPVCMENLCNPIDIEIEWDLLGDFITYKELPENPLTKFDHKPLTEEDHKRLKDILSNKESLLQDYKMEDLVDTNQLIYSEEIDGMTGATSKTFANDIVPGAIYTCYALWNFVNGDLRSQLLDYSKSIWNDDLIISMVQSGKINYLDYILGSDTRKYSPKVNNALGALIWENDPMVSVKAISVVHDEYWANDSISGLFASKFLELSNPVRNALIRHFQGTRVSKDYLSVFIHFLPDLSESQRNQVYEIFKFNADELDAGMRRELVSCFNNPRYSMAAKEYELLSILGIDY